MATVSCNISDTPEERIHKKNDEHDANARASLLRSHSYSGTQLVPSRLNRCIHAIAHTRAGLCDIQYMNKTTTVNLTRATRCEGVTEAVIPGIASMTAGRPLLQLSIGRIQSFGGSGAYGSCFRKKKKNETSREQGNWSCSNQHVASRRSDIAL